MPTFDDAIAYGAIEKELGKSVSQVFETLSASPVASASLGQVRHSILDRTDANFLAYFIIVMPETDIYASMY